MTALETAGLVVGLAIVVAALVVMARVEPSRLVVLAVTILTLALLAAWIADPKRADTLVPLIGVGLGALTGAVTNLFDTKRKDEGP